MASYNYDMFSSGDYDFTASTGPQIGDKAPDFDLITSDGTSRRLLDIQGTLLVLELGSITCPLFQSRRRKMNRLRDRYPGIETAILYVREAHPGADIPGHKTIADKRACAQKLEREDGEGRLILIDDLTGSAHQAYGGMPNAVFILNRNGCVLFRADWNNPAATEAALCALLEDRPLRARSYFLPATPATAIRTFRRAGRGSAPDFLRSLPHLIWVNLIMRNIRLLLGRPQIVARDTTC